MNNEETILISLNSKYAKRYVDNSTSNCDFYLPVIEIPSQHYIYLSIANGSIPYSFYNIDDTNNFLKFGFIGDDTVNTRWIPQGNYNASQIVNYLNYEMNRTETNNLYKVTYDIITNKITITNSQNFYFHHESTCLELLGFSFPNFTGIPDMLDTIYTLQSDMCVNLLSKSSICIHSNLLSGNISTNPDLFDNTILTQIPVSTPPYSLITFSNQSARSCLYTNTISYINIKLTDQDNNILNLNGCHWSMTLELTVVKFVE